MEREFNLITPPVAVFFALVLPIIILLAMPIGILMGLYQVTDDVANENGIAHSDFCVLMTYRKKLTDEIKALKEEICAIELITNWIEERDLEDE